ncbi:histidine kinase [Gillisia sp. M10.2A]|uniref:Histidine kinase n=1 Tax=Gillisia lutea TaxID=2909668 RepID=A0ABS9EIL6_9FLAO|nr:histidine kinase [Gillisia lutea]MCF4101281.1 histidine kinase [Gillisia lutea]
MSPITKNQSQLYRITYEAYSKFANAINRCKTLNEVGEISKSHLKYLLNFHIIRLSIQQDDRFFVYSIHGNEAREQLISEDELLQHEFELLQNGIPFKTSELPEKYLIANPSSKNFKNPEMWGWLLNKNSRSVIVTLITDENKPFAIGDVDILKLAVDCFEAKFHEIYLAIQLDKKNKSLSDALYTIQEKNEEIQKIVTNQQQVIEARTREIVDKNKKLLQISAMNAHNVREPLSRIQGLIQLFDFIDDKEMRFDIIPKITSSAEEMDKVLQEVIQMATNELAQLKAAE